MTVGSVATRIRRLEQSLGGDAMQRRIRAMSEEELDTRIAEITESTRAQCVERGLDPEGLTSMQMLTMLAEREKAEGVAD